MPGLLGFVAAASRPAPATSISRMRAAMARGGRLREEWLDDPAERWALGRVHLGVLRPETQLGVTHSTHVMVHGELDDTAEAAGAVRGLYERYGTSFGRQAEGTFAIAVLDTLANRLVLASDSTGSYPLYWAHVDEQLIFAGELRAVLRHPAVSADLNAEAVADYLAFGFPLGDRTLAAAVHLLPAGSTLAFDANADRVEIVRHVRISDTFRETAVSYDAFVDALVPAFSKAVAASVSGHHAVGMSLSGGLDSRLILSAMPDSVHDLRTYTLGVSGCADEVIADRLARMAGTRHRFFPLTDAYLADFLPTLRRMVSLTDGMYLSHGLTEMLALRFLDELQIDVLVRGHGGELAKAKLAWPWHTDAQIHAMRSRDEFVPYFLRRVNYLSGGVDMATLFTPSWAERVHDAPRRSLEAAIDDVDLAPADLCSYLYLAELHRRFTIGSLELFRNVVEVRLPFVDLGFLRVLFTAPAAWRDDTRLHVALMQRLGPELLRVRNSNTGAPGDAGRLSEAVYERVNSLLRRLNVRGYRHYHAFDAWMRERLLESVESEILSPRALARGIFQPDTLKRLLSETRSGAADHAYLFQVLLILELWQQEQESPA